MFLQKTKTKTKFDIDNSTSATGTKTFCFTCLDDINKPHQADVGGYSFLLDREQNLQQGAAGDQHWRGEKQKTVARLSHLNHRWSQHNSWENAENSKCVTTVASSRGLFTGINRGNKLNEHNFISPEERIKEKIYKQMVYFNV